MDSLKYPTLYEKTSSIRKKYGNASLKVVENYQNCAWIMGNINILKPGDVATLVEYNREPSIRELMIKKLYTYY